MADLIKPGGRPWGEDPHRELVQARESGEIAEHAEKAVYRSYMRALRENFQKDSVTRSILDRSHPATVGMEELTRHLADLLRDGTHDVFQRCLEDLLIELEGQRAAEPSLYLVDEETGKALMPVTEDMVFRPPDYVGEDGVVRKARPVLHPKIAAPVMLARHERGRTSEALARHGAALEHLRNPDIIRDSAAAALEEAGFSVGLPGPGRRVDIEFGRESIEVLQAVNPRFHRAASFGRSLALRVQEAAMGARSCGLGPVSVKKDSKTRWYCVTATFPA